MDKPTHFVEIRKLFEDLMVTEDWFKELLDRTKTSESDRMSMKKTKVSMATTRLIYELREVAAEYLKKIDAGV